MFFPQTFGQDHTDTFPWVVGEVSGSFPKKEIPFKRNHTFAPQVPLGEMKL